MGQIIQFPGFTAAVSLAPAPQSAPVGCDFPVVRHIHNRRRIRKQNRPEDEQTITTAGLAKSFAKRARALGQTKPDSDDHRFALSMAEGFVAKLPCRNLRIFTTPQDVREGIWMLWRQARIATLEWKLCDERRYLAALRREEAEKAYWSRLQDEADDRRWQIYERLIRVPATKLSEVRRYKLDKALQGGMGCIDWMRQHKPEIAAIIDEEMKRLSVEKEARRAARLPKQKETVQ